MTTAAFISPAAPLKKWPSYMLAFAACGLTTLIAFPLRDRLDLANTVMLFLLAVALIAARLGRGPSILAAFCSVALFDFFFVPPRFSFTVSDAQYLVTFTVMLAVAILISQLTAGLARQLQEAQLRERRSHALYELAKELAGTISLDQVLTPTRAFLNQSFHAEPLLLVPDAAEVLKIVDQPPHTLSMAGRYSAQTVFANGEMAEVDEVNGGEGHTLLLPLRGATRMRGVLAISFPLKNEESLQQHHATLQTVASLLAIAIERLHFVEVAHSSQLEAASERLRSSILSAISHDVRTPLTVVYGLADSLTSAKSGLSPTALETVEAIRDQALQLNNMIGNLLDMARLQSGQIRLHKEWQPLEEVIGASIKLLGRALQSHHVKVQLPADLPLLEFDAVLMERVFSNLLENAVKYSAQDGEIKIGAVLDDGNVEISVCNAGGGFPPDKLSKIFDLFERGTPESSVPGFGVGLAICRTIVEAHGGHMRAWNPDKGGGCINLTLPTGTPPSIEREVEAPSPS
jgi:two-component system sensor histidine kinase KdpD